MVNITEKVWNLQKAFSLRTIEICRFEIIDGVIHFYCIKHAYKFRLREQVGFAAGAYVNVSLVVACIICSKSLQMFGTFP